MTTSAPQRLSAIFLLLLLGPTFLLQHVAATTAFDNTTTYTTTPDGDVIAHPPGSAEKFALGVDKATKVYTACIIPYPPFIIYDNATNTVSGYEWDLFQAVAQAMGLQNTFRIVDTSTLITGLITGACDLAPTSLPVIVSLFPLVPLPTTIQYSYPTYNSGYGIATAVSFNPTDRWSWGRVFTVQLWAVLLGTAAVLAVLTYAAERDYCKRGLGKTKYPTALRPGMYEAIYNTVGKLFNVVQDLKVTSLPGKLISMGWGFLVLVASTTYTAGITAALTAQNFQTTISSVLDLPHYNVVTMSTYVKYFLKYGFIPDGVPVKVAADMEGILNLVTAGTADAMVMDYSWLRYQLSKRCDLALVGGLFQYIDNAVGFGPRTSLSFINQYNAQLVTFKQQGLYEKLEAKYLPVSQCPTLTGSQMIVTFKQLEGLWIILGAFAGMATLLLLLPYLSKNRFNLDVKRTKSMFDVRVKDKDAVEASQNDRAGESVDEGRLKSVKGEAVELHNNASYETAGAQAASAHALDYKSTTSGASSPSPHTPTKGPEPRLEGSDKNAVVFLNGSTGVAESAGEATLDQGDEEEVVPAAPRSIGAIGQGSSRFEGGSKPSTPKHSMVGSPKVGWNSAGSPAAGTAAAGEVPSMQSALAVLRLEEA